MKEMAELKRNELIMESDEFRELWSRVEKLSTVKPSRYEKKILRRAKHFARLGL